VILRGWTTITGEHVRPIRPIVKSWDREIVNCEVAKRLIVKSFSDRSVHSGVVTTDGSPT